MRIVIMLLMAASFALAPLAEAQTAGPSVSTGGSKASTAKTKRAHRVSKKRTAKPVSHRTHTARATTKVKTHGHPAASTKHTAGDPVLQG